MELDFGRSYDHRPRERRAMFQRILTLTGCLLVGAVSPLAAKDPAVIHIGLLDSLVKELSAGRQQLLEAEFEGLVRDFTGFKSEVARGGAPFEAAKKLESDEWHLAVFQGVEFAWAQAQHPKLKPLAIAVNNPREVHAFLLAKKGAGKGAADLKGKDVNLLQGKVHCRLFAAKVAGGDPQAFFGNLLPISSGEMALDNVLRGKVAAALVDQTTVDAYKRIHPGRFDKLETAAQSERFPSTVIVYRDGVLSERVLNGFRDGMIKANQSDRGREAMANFKIAAFEPVPADYAQTLESIRKVYPAPAK
jgi:ABC-type phosphate/phosphonate transport system substrate-binding protein